MHIWRDESEAMAAMLAAGLARDPSSFGGWQLLHIQFLADILPSSTEFHQAIPAAWAQPGDDCHLLILRDGNLLQVMRGATNGELRRWSERWHHFAENAFLLVPDIRSYQLDNDAAILVPMLLLHAGATAVPPELLPAANMPLLNWVSWRPDLAANLQAERQHRQGQPMTALLVDDDPVMQRMAGRWLGQYCDVVVAGTASEGLNKYLLHAPDVVFLDIGLPDASGYALLQQLLRLDRGAYVVMLSGRDDVTHLASALALGAQGFVAKPFEPSRVRFYLTGCANHADKFRPQQTQPNDAS